MPDEPPSEAALVAAIGAELARAGRPADLSDDCARLRGHTDLVTHDDLVAGVHFDRRRDRPEQIGAQAAVANLSDLAASGGAAGWLVWSLVLPCDVGLETVRRLTRGFAETAARHGAAVVGGNLTRTPGPLTIPVTAGGPLVGPRALTRSGARPGDALYVTGPLGDAAIGHLFPDAAARAARHRWRPHLREAAALARWGRATAAMDISDGLLLDAARLGDASGVGIDVDRAGVPVSDHYRARLGDDLDAALGDGEDFELLFAAPPDAPPPIAAWRVGTCSARPGLRLDGRPIAPRGHDHFGSA